MVRVVGRTARAFAAVGVVALGCAVVSGCGSSDAATAPRKSQKLATLRRKPTVAAKRTTATPTTKALSKRVTPSPIPPVLVATTTVPTSPTTSPRGSGATVTGEPQLPPVARPGSPGVGSVLVARPAAGACGRVGAWRIMPLGDSLTGGSADVGGYADSYRRELWKLLQARGHTDIDFVGNLRNDDGTFDGDHSGWGGYTTGPDNGGPANLYVHIANFVPQQFTLNESSGNDWVSFADPDIVLLNIGTNDGEGDPAVVERRLAGLVEIITKRAPSARIILSSLPPSGGNFAIVGHVGLAAQKIAQASGGRIFYADIRTRMMLGDADVGAAPFAASDWHGNGDSVHMSASGGKKFALAWLPAVEAALKAPRCA
jgi:lysophospholipase L1-like esterase